MNIVNNYLSGLTVDDLRHIVINARDNDWLRELLHNAPNIQWLNYIAVPSHRGGVAQKMAGVTGDTPPEVLNDYINSKVKAG